MSAAHRAQRLCFEVAFATRGLAEAQQEVFAHFASRRAPDVIGEVCEAACDPQTQWRMDRLEVDLGQVFADEMEHEWARRLRERLALLLQERAQHESGEASDATDVMDARCGRRNLSAAALQDLCGFLQSGVLPWSRGSGPELVALVRASLRGCGPELSRWLAAHPEGRSRLALQCPTAVAEATATTELRERFLSRAAAAHYEACAQLIPQLSQADAVWLRLQLTRMCIRAAARRGLLNALTEAAWRGICELWLPPSECEVLLSLLAHPVLQSVADPVLWREHLCCSLMLADRPLPEHERLLYRLLLHAASARVEPIDGLIAGLIEHIERRANPDDAPLQRALQGVIDHVPSASSVRSDTRSVAVSRLRALRLQVVSGLTDGGALPSLTELELLLQHDVSWLRAVLSQAGRDAEQRRRCAAAWGMAGWRQCAQWWLPSRDVAALCALLTEPRVAAVAGAVELCEYAWRCAVLQYPARSVARSRLAAALEATCDASQARAPLLTLTQAMLLERPVPEQTPACSPSTLEPADLAVPLLEPPEHTARRAAARLRLLAALDAGVTSMSESAWCALWDWLAGEDSEWLRQILRRHRARVVELAADLAACYSDQALAGLLAPWYAPGLRTAVLEHVRQWVARSATVDGVAARPPPQHDAELLLRLIQPRRRAVAMNGSEPGAAAGIDDGSANRGLELFDADSQRPAATRLPLAPEVDRATRVPEPEGPARVQVALPCELAECLAIATRREQLWALVLARVWSVSAQGAASSDASPSSPSTAMQPRLDSYFGHARSSATAQLLAALTQEQWRSLELALQGEVSARLSQRAQSSSVEGRDSQRAGEDRTAASQPRPDGQSAEEVRAYVAGRPSLSNWIIERATAVHGAPSLLQGAEAAVSRLRIDEPHASLLITSRSLDRYVVEQVLRALIDMARDADAVSFADAHPCRRALRAALRVPGISEAVFSMLTAAQRGLVLQALQPLDHWILQDVSRVLLDAWSAVVSPLATQQKAELEWRFCMQECCIEERIVELDATSRRCLAWLCSTRHQPDSSDVARRFARWLRLSREERTEPTVATERPAASVMPSDTASSAVSGTRLHGDIAPAALDSMARDLGTASDEIYQALASVLELPDDAMHSTTLATAQQIKTGDALYLDNVGMVLAAPYLPRLFDMLGLVRDDAFVSTAAAQRAVHLLQFMVNGAMTTPEFRLPLNKLLCGLPFALPIVLGVELTAQEQATIEQLLQAMIQHWRILGSTSVAGLRETFLQREGRLTRREEDWHLLVEPRPFDVLLDQLPWGYATIKYPWMEQVLHVQWR